MGQLHSTLPSAVTAVFTWDDASQSFLFWFRGFPTGMNTLTSGLSRGDHYFFQSGVAGVVVTMN